ncbi:MAG: glycosyl hydrolase 53 family protein [Ferruginibacter sp.]
MLNLKNGFIALILLYSCAKKPVTQDQPSSFFANGADVSWLTEMEAAGIKFYDQQGSRQECMQLLKGIGFNSIRLRVWVDPANGWNNKNDVLTKAIRAKNLGMRLMIDFHYSDSWADPGQQNKPAAWQAYDMSGLQTAVYDHTAEVLNLLKQNNIYADWVQVGNETNDGFLWPGGKASVNMANYAALFKAGYSAVKAVSPSSKVMVHLSNGFDNNLFRWNLGGLRANGAVWDVIGMSLYPSSANWAEKNDQCFTNMNDMTGLYGSEIMITEVGMPWTDSAASRLFIKDILNKVKSLPNNKGLGVFYWEPQSYNGWKGYTLGAFNNSGRPTVALDAFR